MFTPKSTHSLTALALSLLIVSCAKQVLPPEAVPVAEASVVPTGALVVLDGSASIDPNSPPRPLLYHWAFRSLPPGSHAAINDPGIVNPSFLADVDGEYELDLIVDNGLLVSPPATVKIAAGPCGSGAPVAAAITASPAAPTTGQVVQLTAAYSDPDNDPSCNLEQALTVRWSLVGLPPGSAAQLNSATSVNPSFTADKPGEYQLQLVVTDSTGRSSAPRLSKVEVSTCGNAAPSVGAPLADPAMPNVAQLVTLSSVVTDSDNDSSCKAEQTLTYGWYFATIPPGSAARLNDSSVESPSFTPDRPGTYVVRLRVTDSTGRSSLSAATSIMVQTCGSAPPVITTLASLPAQPNTGNTIQLTAEVTDADTLAPCLEPQVFSYQWQLLGLPAGSTATLNDARAANPSFAADVPGDYVVRLQVTDLLGNRGPAKDMTVTVSSCGSARPVAVVQAPAAAVPGAVVQVAAAVSDADSACAGLAPEQFSYRWSFDELPAGSGATLNDARVKSPSFRADVPGSYKLKLEATDLAGHLSAAAFATVLVSTCGANTPSVSVAPVAPANIGQLVTVSAVPTDEDNAESCRVGRSADGGVALDGGALTGPLQSFTFAWYFEALPAGSLATLNNASVASPSFVADVAGQYLLRVRVTDSTGRGVLSAPVSVTVNTCGGSAPQVTSVTPSPAPTVALGSGVSLTPFVTDSDVAGCGQSPSFSFAWRFEELPRGSSATLSGASGRVPSFVPDVAGSYVLAVVATDASGRSSPLATTTVVASPCGGNAPAVTGFTPASPLSVSIGQQVRLVGQFEDVDNGPSCQTLLNNVPQTFTYAWRFVQLPAGTQASLNSTSVLTPSFTPDVRGDYTLELVVTDSTGRTSPPRSFTATAAPCGDNAPSSAPLASPSSGALLGSVVQLSAGQSDPDNLCLSQPSPLSCRWTFVQLPSGSRASFNDPSVCNPSFIPDRAADSTNPFLARVVVTDSSGRQSAPRDVSITTNGTCGANAPVAAVSCPTSVAAFSNVQVTGAPSTDADVTACGLSQTLFYRWNLFAAPVGSAARLNSETAINPWFRADVSNGTWVLRLQVTDSTGLTSANVASCTITTP